MAGGVRHGQNTRVRSETKTNTVLQCVAHYIGDMDKHIVAKRIKNGIGITDQNYDLELITGTSFVNRC